MMMMCFSQLQRTLLTNQAIHQLPTKTSTFLEGHPCELVNNLYYDAGVHLVVHKANISVIVEAHC